jgi:4-carboxymuconolactone decarboxylase
MTHIAIQEHLDGKTVEWMEKVSDTQYGTPVDARGSGSPGPARSVADGSAQPTPAQRLIGDFAPKLVELTDNVLFGDV